jgi:hypothetical protein
MRKNFQAIIGPVLLLVTILGLLAFVALAFRPDPGSAILRASSSPAMARTKIVRAATAPAKAPDPQRQPLRIARYVPRLHAHKTRPGAL